jgi:glycosyltransferase involved in cell wall biosynthesis
MLAFPKHRPVAPTVSVVIPTYNRSRLLIRAIESVMAQTYTNYELIVIDDGSTDDTRDRLNPYEERIRYFYQANRGASAAQNQGIKVARGEWVSILASDDVWLPTKIERQIQAVTALGGEFGACFTDCALVGDPGRKLSEFEQVGLDPQSESGPLYEPFKYIFGRTLPLRVQSLLVRRALLLELGGFDEFMVVEEDVDLVFRLALKTSFCVVSAPLVIYDVTPSRSRLSGLYSRSDRIYNCIDYKYRKWLAMPELLDHEIRQMIQDQLRALTYSWTIAKLYHLRPAAALQKVNEIRRTGDSYPTILFTLLSRAASKVSRTLRGRAA